MNILIEVTTPGNGRTYEILLDDKLSVGAAKAKIIEQITDYENGGVAFDDSAAMFSPVLRKNLPETKNLRSAGISGGQTLYLL